MVGSAVCNTNVCVRCDCVCNVLFQAILRRASAILCAGKQRKERHRRSRLDLVCGGKHVAIRGGRDCCRLQVRYFSSSCYFPSPHLLLFYSPLLSSLMSYITRPPFAPSNQPTLHFLPSLPPSLSPPPCPHCLPPSLYRHPERSPIYGLCVSMLIINYIQICLPCIVAVIMIPVFCFCMPCLIRLLARLQIHQGATAGATEGKQQQQGVLYIIL